MGALKSIIFALIPKKQGSLLNLCDFSVNNADYSYFKTNILK